ncbi:hypothetical protein GUJ93_ZPchr0009g1921 [Zizania palustris]|uniref:Uncharacterized protein n=1 Tax=Zizania palustris TaxID=103762 RepID=A0A8J5RP83_ZIZPA|nr:hypothetical protein GUJ93_ZPchr0009g1921 [Zizania palustris]
MYFLNFESPFYLCSAEPESPLHHVPNPSAASRRVSSPYAPPPQAPNAPPPLPPMSHRHDLEPLRRLPPTSLCPPPSSPSAACPSAMASSPFTKASIPFAIDPPPPLRHGLHGSVAGPSRPSTMAIEPLRLTPVPSGYSPEPPPQPRAPLPKAITLSLLSDSSSVAPMMAEASVS